MKQGKLRYDPYQENVLFWKMNIYCIGFEKIREVTKRIDKL